MQSLSETQLFLTLVALAVVLVLGRAFGELARRIGQPEVLGEFVGGFILGPSALGWVLPGLYDTLFSGTATGFVLSGLSWLGAVLLLLIAGLEVDLPILRSEIKTWSLAAAGAILSALVAGTVFMLLVLHRPLLSAFFLGIVLSVTAVSVVAKILIEREALRRRYAQVMLAAGVASEILVWLFISVAEAAHTGAAGLALRSAALAAIFAIGFFLLAMTLGRYIVFGAMRYVADRTGLVRGQLSLVLVLMLAFGAITMALGLHPLLGAFVFGVLLSQAPRATRHLQENVQTLTSSLFAPIFFVLAGMRVNLRLLDGFSAIGVIALLFVVVTLAKAGFAMLGARLGGLRWAESALVGVGLNLKGGTDVIVAIIGVELGLLSERIYTLYAVVAILTVLLSPPALAWLARHAPPSEEEQERLEREEAERRAYVPSVERVLMPMAPALLPGLAGEVIEQIAVAKHEQNQLFDVTQLDTGGPAAAVQTSAEAQPEAAKEMMEAVATLKNVEVVEEHWEKSPGTLKPILDAAKSYDLIALGAAPEPHRTTISFGRLQDVIIQKAQTDILVVASKTESVEIDQVRRILVPINGMEYSTAAADIAASIASALGVAREGGAREGDAREGGAGAEEIAAADAGVEAARQDTEVVLLHIITAQMDALFWRDQGELLRREVGMRVVDEVQFRIKRLGVQVVGEARLAGQPWAGILAELRRQPYQLIVMGAYNRAGRGRPYLGSTVRTVIARTNIPLVLLLTHTPPGAIGAAA